MSEELKKEWEGQFDLQFTKDSSYPGVRCLRSENPEEIKSFISSLLAKQQEEFVKIVEEQKTRFRCGACEGAKCGHTHCCMCIADIKSKLR